MKSRYLFMKGLGLLIVIIGFSYCITSFNNFFSYIFKTKIWEENLYIGLMSAGLVVPLFVFVYGVFFYFYTDFNITKINKFIFISNVIMLVVGILMLGVKLLDLNMIVFQIFKFMHISLSYCLLFISTFGIYGCFKYKF